MLNFNIMISWHLISILNNREVIVNYILYILSDFLYFFLVIHEILTSYFQAK